MPQNYQLLNPNTDRTTTKTLLHEAIPVTGTILSATYGTYPNEGNIKNYTHGMFQSVYDYPYLSSSANHIFDITMGYDESSALSASTGYTMQKKKINIYNQMSQVLLGYTGSTNQVEIFESDLDYGDNDRQMRECFFLNFSRLLSKDQIKPGTFSLTLGSGSWANPMSQHDGRLILTDRSASLTQGTKNTPGGTYGVLYSGSNADSRCGLVFYEAAVVVLSASCFMTGAAESSLEEFYNLDYVKRDTAESMVSSSISGNCDALRHRIYDLSYNNTTEINSTIYFCRAPHNSFNYSSNPTYTTSGKINVKNVASDPPVSYITTVGLYNAQNELLAVAKLSEPLKKDPTNEITLRVRLDY
tara:strand:+ start:647 stop:1720 length:1074 start_codon:yes stop_codon:yes gene_type:complete